MTSDQEFIVQSLELNLFFMRIAKEHSFFIEVAIPSKNFDLIAQADSFKNRFAGLLTETTCLADGYLTPEFLNSGEMVTDLTLEAERGSEFYSGYTLNTEITLAERTLSGGLSSCEATTVQLVGCLNAQAMTATRELIDFKARLLRDVLACQVFTFNYPLLLDHILREARFYLCMLERIQCRQERNLVAEAVEQEIFWNRIMAEHAKFIRGLVDPTEEQLFTTADNFGKQFDGLTLQAQTLLTQTAGLPNVTEESRRATVAIRDFKRQGTEGLITCRIRSIAHPLLGDHVMREANHFLRLLRDFEQGFTREFH